MSRSTESDELRDTHMRTPQNLASAALATGTEHAKRASTLRRLATGLRAQSTGELGLNDKERKVLTSAALLLEEMATASQQAAVLSKRRATALADREREVRSAMRANFGALASIEDKVALIGAAQSYSLHNPELFKNPHHLGEAFEDAITGLVESLARATGAKPAHAVVNQAWAKFLESKASIQAKHRALITGIQTAGRAPSPR